MTTTLCFVGARRGNAFMNELLAAVAHEVEAAGMPTELAFDELPEGDSRVYVLIPHEYYACVRDELHPDVGAARADHGLLHGAAGGAVVRDQ